MGGRDGSFCLKIVECFDFYINKWLYCSFMLKRRGGVGVVICNGFLYVVGGYEVFVLNLLCCRFDCVERYLIFFILCYMLYILFNVILVWCVFCGNVFLKFG